MINTKWLTIDDFEIIFGEDDLPIDDEGEISQERFDVSLESGINVVESYVRKIGIAMPFSDEVKSNLKYTAMDIVRFKYSNNAGESTTEKTEAYENAIKYLKDINSGKIVLEEIGSVGGGWKTMNLYRV